MTYMYSIPLEVTGPSMTYHSICPIDLETVFKLSLLSPEDFNKRAVTSSNNAFNAKFTTLKSLQDLITALDKRETVSWATKDRLYVVHALNSETESYLSKKGCLRSKIVFFQATSRFIFDFNYFEKDNDKALYIGNDSWRELNKVNIKYLHIPSCEIEHCIREYLFNLEKLPVVGVKTFTEDGRRFQIQVKTLKQNIQITKKHFF